MTLLSEIEAKVDGLVKKTPLRRPGILSSKPSKHHDMLLLLLLLCVCVWGGGPRLQQSTQNLPPPPSCISFGMGKSTTPAVTHPAGPCACPATQIHLQFARLEDAADHQRLHV